MIVSIAIAVLPVWRSPMMSSRWPRPIGIIESIAFRPVCSGSVTGWRWTTPGALNSAGRGLVVSMSPLPSSGSPSGSTMRPSRASPTGISRSWPVRLTVSPSTILLPVAEEHDADVVGLEVQREAAHVVRELEHLERHAVLEAVDARDAVADGEDGADLGQLGRPLVEPLDAALEDGGDLVGLDLHGCVSVSLGDASGGAAGDLLAQALEAVADGGVEDLVADAQDDAAEDVGVDAGGELDLAAGLLADAVADALDGLLVELDRRGDLDREDLVLVLPQRVVARGGCGTGPACGASRRAARGSSRRSRPRPRGRGQSPSFFSSVEK